MKRIRTTALTLAAFTFLGTGCASYYSVIDPASSKEYFSTKKPKRSGGSVVFKDHVSGAEVSLSSAEVHTITKDQFRAGTRDFD